MTEIVFDESKCRHPFLEVSSFEVMFPKHRTAYFQSIEKYAVKACEVKKILLEIDYDATLLRVSTTQATRDPFIILKAFELIQLLGRSFLLESAIKVLDDGFTSEIIPVHMLCASQSIFERRRQRIANPKVLKSLELITKCTILISNKTACILGTYKGVNQAKKVIIACFENIHPAFELKRLIIKNKLLDENKEGDWDRLLPKIKKTHSKTKKSITRVGGALPEEIKDRKADEEMNTGVFFTHKENVEKLEKKEINRKRREDKIKRKEERHTILDE